MHRDITNSEAPLERCARRLRDGGVVVHATEGVWGLAACVDCPQAIARVVELKGRDAGKGLIVLAGEGADFAPELAGLSPEQRAEVLASWPAAVTWVVANHRFPELVTGGRDTAAIRVPGHEQARALCAAAGLLVSTSANPTGEPPARTEAQAREYFEGRVDAILPGKTMGRRGPSEIRTVLGQVLRPSERKA